MNTNGRYEPLSLAVIRTLCYFDLFDYPLRAEEVFHFLQSNNSTAAEIRDQLMELTQHGIVYNIDNFFSLRDDPGLIKRRLNGNRAAVQWKIKAEKMGRLIQSFPFVSSVMVSGSLSKGYMDENCDLDFFIVTTAKRLWIARMLLVLYKRLFLGGSHKYFCVNYFVDEEALAIDEKKIFTATELATLIPITGNGQFEKLIRANGWIKEFLPNNEPKRTEKYSTGSSAIKKILEAIINGCGPLFWNRVFMNLTLRRWRRLYAKGMKKADFELAFRTKPDVSKNHPRQFQKKILLLYQQKVQDILKAKPVMS